MIEKRATFMNEKTLFENFAREHIKDAIQEIDKK